MINSSITVLQLSNDVDKYITSQLEKGLCFTSLENFPHKNLNWMLIGQREDYLTTEDSKDIKLLYSKFVGILMSEIIKYKRISKIEYNICNKRMYIMFNDDFDYQVVTDLTKPIQFESSTITLDQDDFKKIFKHLLFDIDHFNMHNHKVFFDPTHIYITQDKCVNLLMPISSVWFKTEFIDIVHIFFKNQSSVFFGKTMWFKTNIESVLMFNSETSLYLPHNNDNVNTDLINLIRLAENVFKISIPEEFKKDWVIRDVLKWALTNVKTKSDISYVLS